MGSHDVVLSVMEYKFIGGSMGAVVGETIARAVDRALATRKPLIIVSSSGGARMMEGIVSLMQLAKISAGLAKMDDEKIPYIAVLTDPTTGGVTASFAMLGDLNIAEPGALIGFAGPRVIEQTIRQKLPEGFQRSEFLLQHGMLDAVVTRKEMKQYIIRALDFMTPAQMATVITSERRILRRRIAMRLHSRADLLPPSCFHPRPKLKTLLDIANVTTLTASNIYP